MGLFIVSIILFIALVVVHELGHFWAARRNGVKAEEFGIFFPPTLWRKKMKSGFDFCINLLPLGGYVKLKGEHDSDTEQGSFGAASDWVKTKIMLAGVGVNLVVALLLFTVAAGVGMPHLTEHQFVVAKDAQYVSHAKTVVIAAHVDSGSPAEKAGLKVNDHIVALWPAKSVQPTNLTKATELSDFTKAHAGQPVEIEIVRGTETKKLTATLRSNEEIATLQAQGKTAGRLGVQPAEKYTALTVVRSTWSAPVVAVGTAVQYTALTFKSLGNVLQGLGSIVAGTVTQNKEARMRGQTEASQVGGPVAIIMTLKAGAELGVRFVLFIIALLSLSLAIMNVLPVPALDGGRLYMMLASRLTKKKRFTPKTEEAIVGWSFVVLLSLIALITFVDVKRFF